jgi:hypothetical protein
MRRSLPVLLAAAVVLLLAAPLAAYTIYFKDGRTLNVKGKPRVANGRALVTLLNGTQASLDPAQIDEKKTEEMNQRDLGAAVILDQGTARQQQPGAPAQPAPKQHLSDIASREIGPRDQPVVRRTPAPAGGTAASSSRVPYGDAAVAAELEQFFRGQKAEGVAIYQGSQGRPLAQVTTSTDSAVFRALLTGANALLHVRGRFPQKVDGLELVRISPEGERGGQFTLTPAMAEDLVAKRVGLISFFLNNVQF